MDNVSNPYLEGNYAPVLDEATLVDLDVVGEIPSQLNGRYLRIGPNPLAVEPSNYNWFTGDGMVHGFRLRDGTAEWYRNRFVRSSAVAQHFGEPEPSGPIHGGMDTANTNVMGIGDRTFALVEAGANPVELTYELETIARNPFDGTYEGGYTAHPKLHPNGDLHAMTYHWAWGNNARYVVTNSQTLATTVEELEMGGPAMVHDMAMSNTRGVLFDLPCLFDLDAVASGFPYRWNNDYQARIGVFNLYDAARSIRWIAIDPCYVFHPLNAFDAPDGTLVIDLVVHPRVFATDHAGPNEGAALLERWEIPSDATAVRRSTLIDDVVEFPRHHPGRVGSDYQYGWCVSINELDDGTIGHGDLVKADVERGTSERFDYGDHRQTLEPVFVPREGATNEDDGWVISVVYDTSTETSDLVIINGEDLSHQATVKVPRRIPYGFHGNWVPDN